MHTGFGADNTVESEFHCKHVHTLTHLYKESYLSEFFTEEEKQRARENLGVLSYNDMVSRIDAQLSQYATKLDLQRAIAEIGQFSNYYTKDEIDNLFVTKDYFNNAFTLDDTPTRNSNRAVTSHGIWQYIDTNIGEIRRVLDLI